MNPLVSVVIPTLNEEKYIGKTLDRLTNQNFKDFEIIIVDGGSGDDTVEIAKKYGVKTIISKGANVCKARNIGLYASRGQIVVGADADTIYPINHLSSIYEEFKNNEDVIAVTGRWEMVEAPYWATVFWRLINFILDFVYANFGLVLYAPALNLSFKKQVLLDVGGYNEFLDFGGDEIDILNKLKKYRMDNGRKGKIIFKKTLEPKINGRRWNVGFFKVLFREVIYGYWLNYILRKYFSKDYIRAKPVR